MKVTSEMLAAAKKAYWENTTGSCVEAALTSALALIPEPVVIDEALAERFAAHCRERKLRCVYAGDALAVMRAFFGESAAVAGSAGSGMHVSTFGHQHAESTQEEAAQVFSRLLDQGLSGTAIGSISVADWRKAVGGAMAPLRAENADLRALLTTEREAAQQEIAGLQERTGRLAAALKEAMRLRGRTRERADTAESRVADLEAEASYLRRNRDTFCANELEACRVAEQRLAERDTAIARAEAAEARVRELEGELREMTGHKDHWHALCAPLGREIDGLNLQVLQLTRNRDTFRENELEACRVAEQRLLERDTAQAELARLREGVEKQLQRYPWGRYDISHVAMNLRSLLNSSPPALTEQGAGEAGPRELGWEENFARLNGMSPLSQSDREYLLARRAAGPVACTREELLTAMRAAHLEWQDDEQDNRLMVEAMADTAAAKLGVTLAEASAERPVGMCTFKGGQCRVHPDRVCQLKGQPLRTDVTTRFVDIDADAAPEPAAAKGERDSLHEAVSILAEYVPMPAPRIEKVRALLAARVGK